MRVSPFAGCLACLTVSLCVATKAWPAAQRTFVASTGNDANPCSLAQPCRGFAAAVAKTSPKGEVIVLDSAGYGAVTITQSVSIIAPPGVYAGISVFTGSGITVNGSGIEVSLRGLSINGQGGSVGIDFVQGNRLTVDSCEISNPTSHGIRVTANDSKIAVTNTVLRGSYVGFEATNAVAATLERVHLRYNATGIQANDNARITVSNSTIAYSIYGVFVQSFAPPPFQIPPVTEAIVSRSIVTETNEAFVVYADAATTARLVSDGNSINNVQIGYDFLGAGGSEAIYSAGNNSAALVYTFIFGGSLTPCCAH